MKKTSAIFTLALILCSHTHAEAKSDAKKVNEKKNASKVVLKKETPSFKKFEFRGGIGRSNFYDKNNKENESDGVQLQAALGYNFHPQGMFQAIPGAELSLGSLSNGSNATGSDSTSRLYDLSLNQKLSFALNGADTIIRPYLAGSFGYGNIGLNTNTTSERISYRKTAFKLGVDFDFGNKLIPYIQYSSEAYELSNTTNNQSIGTAVAVSEATINSRVLALGVGIHF